MSREGRNARSTAMTASKTSDTEREEAWNRQKQYLKEAEDFVSEENDFDALRTASELASRWRCRVGTWKSSIEINGF